MGLRFDVALRTIKYPRPPAKVFLMHVVEQECPNCNVRLRLRAPLRNGETFGCPDCRHNLLIRASAMDAVIVSNEAGPTLSGTQPSSPTRVGSRRLAYGIAVLGFAGFVSWMSNGDSTAGRAPSGTIPDSTAPVDVAESPSVDPAPQQPVPQLTEEAVPTIAAQVPESESPDPDPEPVVIAADQESPGVPAAETSEQSPDPDAVSPEQIARAEYEKALRSEITRKLSLKLDGFRHSQPVALADFLGEVGSLSGTDFYFSDLPDATVELQLEACSVTELLEAGLTQAGLSHEIRADGIHILSGTRSTTIDPE